ncbi:MAG: chemotaxis response regulator protein-glutamate methylesterase [Planctomycetaceae bacterium]|nr:chemotaxis response regulator protein-glutamate methylesterase [Planctomycetales bacterium]MCB9927754.1 chemotaxis response regulator protein-glutamate methylesterase [Planctomycetaceae bacterium]
MRVLVVDDSTLFRKFVRDALLELPDVEVVGVAANGKIALEKLETLCPDLLTLDIEMPELDGLGVLRELRQRHSSVGVILLSAFTGAGARMTTTGLGLGAFDFVLKPTGNNAKDSLATLRNDLLPKVKAFVESRRTKNSQSVSRRLASDVSASPCTVTEHATPEVIVIGVSTGGPKALATLLPKLPADLPVPVMIVQHMPPLFTATLAADLNRDCRLNVCEAQDYQRVEPGNIYIAPGGKQMGLVGHSRPRGEVGVSVPMRIRITDDEPERGCKPSVDYLFRSAAEIYDHRVLAVVMTGMGDDGTAGCRILKQHGAQVVAQNEASCVVYGMPRSVVEAGLADIVCPLDHIATTIGKLVGQGRLLCK